MFWRRAPTPCRDRGSFDTLYGSCKPFTEVSWSGDRIRRLNARGRGRYPTMPVRSALAVTVAALRWAPRSKQRGQVSLSQINLHYTDIRSTC
jgi:hypothetical protein